MVQIFITGGTFDKSYNHISGDLFFEKTHIPEMLKRSKSRLNVEVKTLMMIDSLEMTESDINKIIKECIDSKSERIVITHGTDTMVNTASKIAKKINNKTIVLTGAMIPYAFGSSSDGFFNLGSALSFVQTLERGVYITMNGQYFNYNNVIKDKEKGYFKSL
ncbi:MAG: asparaginase [Flavobacteriaceae bacterium]|jgi:L-asparaginase|nr:asparaginase [Flavobacteriaceae bacterium]